MLALAFRFPAGRYHATPWGRHVNEAEVEWPPSPWRILRALIATWHRKVDPQRHPQDQLATLVTKLAGAVPGYHLPNATRAHTRHYVPVRDGKKDKPVLIFDGFVHIAREEELVVAWPESVGLEAAESALLDELLEKLGFLGRAESWVEARRLASFDEPLNCEASELSIEAETGEVLEPITLLAPLSAERYAEWHTTTEAELDWSSMKPKARANLRRTLPERLIDAMCLDTRDIQTAGWSRPPGSQFLTYQRPYAALLPEQRRRTRRTEDHSGVTTARLMLAGRPLPRIEDAVRIGELVRRATLAKAGHIFGVEGIPWTLSGHEPPAGNRHGHAFYLPDPNRDGRIEHVLVHVKGGLQRPGLRALGLIRSLYEANGGEWQVVLENYGPADAFGNSALMRPARTWISVTPYLHPWFCKKKFQVKDQILRECGERSLPAPEIERVPSVRIKGRERRPVHFHRFRSRRGLTQPDTQGSFWRLTFSEPVAGPLALGFGCHYGLGLFRAAEED